MNWLYAIPAAAVAFLILADPAVLLWLAGCAVVYAGFLWFAELVLGDKPTRK